MAVLPRRKPPPAEQTLDELLDVAKSIQRMVGVITIVLGLAAIVLVLSAIGVNLPL